jgi:hypothetical protein
MLSQNSAIKQQMKLRKHKHASMEWATYLYLLEQSRDFYDFLSKYGD